jgi:hypothetical protein
LVSLRIPKREAIAVVRQAAGTTACESNWNGQNGYLYDNGGNYRYYYGTNAPGHYIYDEDGNAYYIYGR